MVSVFKDFLFKRNIIVRDFRDDQELTDEEQSMWCSALMLKYGYNVVNGKENVTQKVFAYVGNMLDATVPAPFYQGFPDSVRSLTDDEILFDKLYAYYRTYWLDDFSKPVHSVLEDYNPVEKVALLNSFKTVNVEVVDEATGIEKLNNIFSDMLKQTRALSSDDYGNLLTFLKHVEFNLPEKIGSKNTVIKLLVDLKDIKFAKYLTLNQFPDFVEELAKSYNKDMSIKKLHLPMKSRRFVAEVLHKLIDKTGRILITADNCLEKRQIWKGILHHIHYKVDHNSQKEGSFFNMIYGDKNPSTSSYFERNLKSGKVDTAMMAYIKAERGTELYRHLNYIIANTTDITKVFNILETHVNPNPLVLIQLYNNYADILYKRAVSGKSDYSTEAKTYTFKKDGLLKVHAQTLEEFESSTTRLTDEQIELVRNFLKEQIRKCYARSNVYQIYVDPKMKNIALPLNQSVSNSGVGNLPCGSRIDIPEDTIIRAFTYWEKVNDIDLSALLYSKNMQKIQEFSWRSFGRESWHKPCIVFSGDQTSGYNGGSEYFDIDIDKLRSTYPNAKYLIFNDNVYSGVEFKNIFCKAGFMVRDKMNSGAIYEPKTVRTSWAINSESTFVHLFAIDLETRQMIWLNLNPKSMSRVAGQNDMTYLLKYLTEADMAKMNMWNVFSLMGINKPMDECVGKYDLVVTADKVEVPEDSEATYITPQDTELIMKYLECKK